MTDPEPGEEELREQRMAAASRLLSGASWWNEIALPGKILVIGAAVLYVALMAWMFLA